MAGYTVPIASETKAFKQGVETGIIKPLEEAQDAADALGKTRGPEQLERDLKAAQKATETLKDDTERAARAIEQDYRNSYRQMKQSADEGLSGVSDKTREVGDEIKTNLGETFSSFRGDLTDLPQIAQDTLGGLAGSGALGGIAGIAATAAGAAGLGLIIGALENGQLTAEEMRAKVAELAQALIDAGEDGGPAIDFLVERLQAMATNAEDTETSLKELKELADGSESSFSDLAQAAGLNAEGLREMWRESDRAQREYQKLSEANDTLGESTEYTYRQLLEMGEAQGKVTDYLGQQIGLSEQAAEAQRLYAEAGGPELEAKAGLIGAINSAYDDAAGSAGDFINAESGVFDTGAYITAMQEREEALRNYQTSIASSGLTTEAIAFLNEQGVESAAQMLAGYQSAAPGQKSELNRIWTEAGKDSSGAYTKSIDAALPTKVAKKPVVELQASTWEAERAIDRVANEVRTTTIRAIVVDEKGRRIIP
jgi:hypothetical protein